MKLYYAPGTCSLSPHILLRETEADFSLERVDLRSRATAGGGVLDTLNPKGKVPVLVTDDDALLTEGAVIAQYIVERAGGSTLLPPVGDPARYQVLMWQTFVTTELHKSYTPLFKSVFDASTQAQFAAELRRKYEWVNEQLRERPYLAGEQFSVADSYFFAVSRWAPMVGLELTDLAEVQACLARIRQRPAVQAALAAEGLS